MTRNAQWFSTIFDLKFVISNLNLEGNNSVIDNAKSKVKPRNIIKIAGKERWECSVQRIFKVNTRVKRKYIERSTI